MQSDQCMFTSPQNDINSGICKIMFKYIWNHCYGFLRPWSTSSMSKQNASKMASSEGMARITDLLLENGANGDAQDSTGR